MHHTALPLLFFGVVLTVLVVVPAGVVITRTSLRRSGRLLEGGNASPSPANERLVRSYLRASRTARVLGATAGGVFGVFLLVAGQGVFAVVAVTGGFLLGVLGEQAVSARPIVSPVRGALLARRRVFDYVPGWLVWVMRVATGLVVVALAALALVPAGPTYRAVCAGGVVETAARSLPGLWLRVSAATIAVSGLAGCEVTLRWIARRPQPAPDEASAALDDALRASSAHAALGAGLALTVLPLAALLVGVGAGLRASLCGQVAFSSPLASPLIVAGVALAPVALLMWALLAGDFGVRRWHGRRTWDRAAGSSS